MSDTSHLPPFILPPPGHRPAEPSVAVGNGNWPPPVEEWPDHLQLPCTDDRPVENYLQPLLAALLTDTLWDWLRVRHPTGDYAIGRDMGIYWTYAQPPLDGCKAPDWYYVPGVPALLGGKLRRSYVLYKERVPPKVLIEFVSGTGAEERDATEFRGKWWVYETVFQAPSYILFDQERGQLDVFQLGSQGRYVPMIANARGRYLIAPMDLEIGTWKGTIENAHATWIRWFDVDGRMLPTSTERAGDAQRRADDAQQLATDAQRLTIAAQRQASEAQRLAIDAQRHAEEAQLLAERRAAKLRELGIDPDQL